MKNIAIILASGNGSRCELDYPKQFAKVNNKTILEYTVDKFEQHKDIDEIILVCAAEYIEKVKNILSKYKKISKFISGGKTRKESSYNGVMVINENEANVLIHDGVRPFITKEIISNCIEKLKTYDAVCTTIDSSDTIFYINNNNIITDIPDRRLIKRAQTPQCFKLSVIKKAHELAKNDELCTVTDDCGLIMHYNLADILTIDGNQNNIKITYPKDLELFKDKLTN